MNRSGVFVILAAATLAIAVFLSQSTAQAPAPAKPPVARVAVCDVAEVFNNYERAKDLTAEFDQRRKNIQAEDERRGRELKKLEDTLAALRPGSKEHEARLNEFMKASMERQVWRKMQQELAVREHRRLTEGMYNEILRAIAAVAKERGYDVVIYRENVAIASATTAELLNKIAQRKCLYYNPSIDLTKIVLERINGRYRSGRK